MKIYEKSINVFVDEKSSQYLKLALNRYFDNVKPQSRNYLLPECYDKLLIICLFAYLFIYLFVYLFIYLSIYLCIYLFTYLYFFYLLNYLFIFMAIPYNTKFLKNQNVNMYVKQYIYLVFIKTKIKIFH